MLSEITIRGTGLGKAFAIFNKPEDRLKQMFMRGRRIYYCEFWALKNMEIEVRRGETVGIIGANGSGKSTLLQLVCGNMAPTTGEIMVNGRIAALLELGAGFNPQFTGRENVFISAAIMGCETDEITNRFDDIAAFADIGDFIEKPVKTYSSGMYARLAFAVAINVDPHILLVDEILAVGDEAFQRKCFACIERIKQGGGTILLVSHSASAIVDLCDHAILLHEGERLFTGEPKRAVGLYQKLINSPHEYAQEICSEIREVDAVSENDINFGGLGSADAPGLATAAEAGRIEENKRLGELDGAMFEEQSRLDPNLNSESQVVYPPNGAEIKAFRIVSNDGQTVNCLVSGEKYQICFDVMFTTNCTDVRFYTNIRTVTGVPLGGGTYPAISDAGLTIADGKVGTIKFEFTCSLISGTYFINCQVRGNNEQSLHRIVDALVFRVISRKKVFSFGHVDFLYSPKLQLDTE